jgi:hypothetical protein
MPLTYAHPALILPFVGRVSARGWLSGLVAGSMAPDFARLIPGMGREFSHSIPGMFLVDLPLAIALAFLASLILIPRAARLPGLQSLARPSGERFAWHWLALAALIGCATHLGWDVFTHGDHKIFHAAFLDRKIAHTEAGPFRVRQLAWAVNTLAGLAALFVVGLIHLKRARTPILSFLSWPWLRMGAVTLVPLVVLPLEHPIRLATLMNDLAMILHSNRPMVHLAILTSGFGLVALFLFETRQSSRK